MHAQGIYVEIFMDHLLHVTVCATTLGDIKCERPGLGLQGTLIPIRSTLRCPGEFPKGSNVASPLQLHKCKEPPSDSLPGWLVEVHGFFGFVVRSHSEWNDFHRGEARGHAQDLAPMGGLIQVFLGLRVGHSCRVPAHNVEIGPRNHPRPAVPLDLGNI